MIGICFNPNCEHYNEHSTTHCEKNGGLEKCQKIQDDNKDYIINIIELKEIIKNAMIYTHSKIAYFEKPNKKINYYIRKIIGKLKK